jgi:hypothetical protein
MIPDKQSSEVVGLAFVINPPRNLTPSQELIHHLRRSLAMCHGYEMKWKSETTAKNKIKEVTRQKERAKAAPEEKVEEKELIPAE